jgi:cytochrome c biogenesis factor
MKKFEYKKFEYAPFYYYDINGNKYDIVNHKKVLTDGTVRPMTDSEIKNVLGAERYKNYQERNNQPEDSKFKGLIRWIAGGVAIMLVASLAISSNNKD